MTSSDVMTSSAKLPLTWNRESCLDIAQRVDVPRATASKSFYLSFQSQARIPHLRNCSKLPVLSYYKVTISGKLSSGDSFEWSHFRISSMNPKVTGFNRSSHPREVLLLHTFEWTHFRIPCRETQ